MYNKISILEYLVDPESISPKQKELVDHIKSRRDIVELNSKSSDDGIICPITGDILGQTGGKFGYIIECGDLFSIRSLKELENKDNNCPICDLKFNDQDLIIIGAKDKDLIKQEKRMNELIDKNLTHSLKKRKSNKSNNKKQKTTTQVSK